MNTLVAVDVKCVQLDIHRTGIPMRSFEHAAARRDVAEAIVVRLELSDGTVGWGETLPREYVTGETLRTVPGDIERSLWPAVLAGEQQGKALALTHGGRTVTAARCALELALNDAWTRHRWRHARQNMRAMGLRPFPDLRVSGVVGSSDPARTAKRLRLMRWYGLRDFKLKLGLGEDVDAENLRIVHERLGKAVAGGRCTLRVDVNGGWAGDETPERVAALRPRGVCAVEQPVSGPPEALIDLAGRCELPLIADESLIMPADAEKLPAARGKVWANIRLSKNGGIWPSMEIAETLARAEVPFVVGCMVGESGILSTAQRLLLWDCAGPRFIEGNYGKFLLRDDLTRPSPRFGYGGRLRPPPLGGTGVNVDPDRLRRYGRLIKTLRA